MFQINKCNNDTLNKTYMGELKCKPQEEIDQYVERVQVETWSNYY